MLTVGQPCSALPRCHESRTIVMDEWEDGGVEEYLAHVVGEAVLINCLLLAFECDDH